MEVKELAIEGDDKAIIAELRSGNPGPRWLAPGKRLRGPIRSGEKQLRKFAARRLPAVICLLDTTVSFHDLDFHVRAAMYGDETLHFAVLPSTGTGQFIGSAPGKNAMLRRDERTTVSAVAVLRRLATTDTVVDLYHNQFAAIPIDPELAAPFVRQQILGSHDRPETDGPTWFDIRDDPQYAHFLRDPDGALEHVVREILDDKDCTS